MSAEIVIVHLYPRELGINGDVGNVMALEQRATWRGASVRVHNHDVGGELPEVAHVVHIGSGPRSGQELVLDDLSHIAATLREWSAQSVPFLAIAGGWQLLGHELVDADGVRHPGAGVFNSTALLTSHRAVGEVAAQSELGELAGFENHGSVTTLAEDAVPLARTQRGHGNAAGSGPDADAAEGIIAGSRIGTNLHGPFLPMNPVWADWLLERAAALAGVALGDDATGQLGVADIYAEKSRRAIRDRLGL